MSEQSIPADIRNLLADLKFLSIVRSDREPLFKTREFRKLPTMYRVNGKLPDDNVAIIGFQLQELIDKTIAIIDSNRNNAKLLNVIVDAMEAGIQGLTNIKRVYRKYPSVISDVEVIATQFSLQTSVHYEQGQPMSLYEQICGQNLQQVAPSQQSNYDQGHPYIYLDSEGSSHTGLNSRGGESTEKVQQFNDIPDTRSAMSDMSKSSKKNSKDQKSPVIPSKSGKLGSILKTDSKDSSFNNGNMTDNQINESKSVVEESPVSDSVDIEQNKDGQDSGLGVRTHSQHSGKHVVINDDDLDPSESASQVQNYYEDRIEDSGISGASETESVTDDHTVDDNRSVFSNLRDDAE